jgi:type II secretory pathway component PulF
MPVYVYRAMTRSGQQVKNRVEDSSKTNLIRKLKRNNLMPISVVQVNIGRTNKKAKRKNVTDINSVLKKVNTTDVTKRRSGAKITLRERMSLLLSRGERITPKDLRVFTQNFYLLKKANFNNIHALSTIIESTENLSFRAVLEDILAGVEAGENMYTTMEYYTGVFPYIYINMIKVGELSGSLTASLEQAIRYLEEHAAMTKRVKTILVPNIVQFVGIFVMLIVGTLVAIPAIQNVFDTVGSKEQLPAITMWFSNFLDQIVEVWYIPVFLIGAIAFSIVAYIRTPRGKYNFHYFKYTMPIFGKLIYALDFERLMKAILLNIRNGMRIQDAIEVSKNVIQNYVMLSIIETSINNILIGQSWIEPFEKSGLSSPIITEMLKIGMQTDLAEMMEKMLEYMKIDIDEIISKIMKVMPQVVYLFVGGVLIFFVIVVLVPVIQVYMGTFLFSAYGV